MSGWYVVLTVSPAKFEQVAMSILRSSIHAAAILMAFGSVRPNCAADEAGNEFFEKQVRPILAARCYECHSAQAAKLKGGLRLDSRAAALAGSKVKTARSV